MRILSQIFADIAFILLCLTMLKPIIRLLASKFKALKGFNKIMVKSHKFIGYGFIICAILHVIFTLINSLNFEVFGIIGFVFIIITYVVCLLIRKLKKNFRIIHLLSSILLLIFSIIHLVVVGGIKVFDNFNNEEINIIQGNSLYNGEYHLNDGVYQGKGEGLKGEIILEVVIENGLIKDITIIKTSDDPSYIYRVEKLIKTKIIETQSNSVDVKNGATYSSNGYVNAFNEAISKAIKEA